MRVRECTVTYRMVECPSIPKRTITSSQSVYSVMQPYTHLACESIWALLLSPQRRVLAIHECARGGVDSAVVVPSDIFRAAIITGACALILVHNHPSGDVRPSENDNHMTEAVVAAGRLLKISVLDHVVISPEGYYSYLDDGRLPRDKS